MTGDSFAHEFHGVAVSGKTVSQKGGPWANL